MTVKNKLEEPQTKVGRTKGHHFFLAILGERRIMSVLVELVLECRVCKRQPFLPPEFLISVAHSNLHWASWLLLQLMLSLPSLSVCSCAILFPFSDDELNSAM
ncbi:hypothetical protein CHARACLAT_024042 [Characodon lateralis]|uniref:Uncharacterized protein n=1 Tax=Characodon lateralis TaxID=208331 RepID=A0ABU7D0V8_9TELE|nr:hypothetical protein [Characodon lateralis]